MRGRGSLLVSGYLLEIYRAVSTQPGWSETSPLLLQAPLRAVDKLEPFRPNRRGVA